MGKGLRRGVALVVVSLVPGPWSLVPRCLAQAPLPLAARWDRERLAHDALHYDIAVSLPDTGGRFSAEVTTRWRLTGERPIGLDLDSTFQVTRVLLDGRPARWERRGDRVEIAHGTGSSATVTTTVAYQGTPRDGLVLRGNGPGRTIFADNWPDRARHWLASQDHPSDKATAAWRIEAPAGFTVVANGALQGIDTLPNGRARWRFAIAEPIPVYTMVLGAARLATTRLPPAACALRCVPVSVATYPQDSAWAVNGPFRRAGEMVDFFSRVIGPFPYGELRHVQTSTIFGGMENSTVIFYDEKAYAARSLSESTVAHETAHQWFGDAVTETDWLHLWLSEGFATYGAALWAEHQGGDSALRATMRAARETVLRDPVTERPILDSSATDLMKLLNSNNYQKGSWVLHSLRGLMGDSAFFRGLRRYYRTYQHRNALSGDLARIMSEEAGQDLGWYFTQALTQPGYPVLSVRTRLEGGHLVITLRQAQKPEWGRYRLPNLKLRLGGRSIAVNLEQEEQRVVTHWEGETPPEVEVDPEGWWLLETVRGER